MNMTIYGKIEVIDGKHYQDAFVNDVLSGRNAGFAIDAASISRCIRRPVGVISLSARRFNESYELGFIEQALPVRERYIKNDHGVYSISGALFQGVGRVVEICRFNDPEPFAQFYHILTCSNNHRLLWRVGILSFSKEISEEELPEWPDEGYQGEVPHPIYVDPDAFKIEHEPEQS